MRSFRTPAIVTLFGLLLLAGASAVPTAAALPPDCVADLDKVECDGVCRVSYLDAVAIVHAHCLGSPVGEPSPIPQEFGSCHLDGERLECHGLCRVNWLDAGGIVHGHCLGRPVLE